MRATVRRAAVVLLVLLTACGEAEEVARRPAATVRSVTSVDVDAGGRLCAAIRGGESEWRTLIEESPPRSDLHPDPLYCAVVSANVEAARLLLKKGYDPNVFPKPGIPPTEGFREIARYPDPAASRAEFEVVFQALLDSGLDPCWSYPDGWNEKGEPDYSGRPDSGSIPLETAYQRAARRGETAAVELFEAVGANCTQPRSPA